VGTVRARSVAAILVAVSALTTGVAHAGPGDVYNDYAQDGRLTCNHPPADLRAVLRSGSLNQYGDPLTLAGLKLAVRRQLAGGCRASSSTSPSSRARTAATRGGGTPPRTGSRQSGGKSTRKQSTGKQGGPARPRHEGSSAPRESASSSSPISNGGNSAFLSERVLVAGLLAGALGIGGWLTRRALTARS
jgi:cobalamin biosynthesis Mg chelatase CobN